MMGRAFILALSLHVLIIILLVVQPVVPTPEPEMMQPVSVKILPIQDKTVMPPPAPKPLKKKPVEDKPQMKQKEDKKPKKQEKKKPEPKKEPAKKEIPKKEKPKKNEKKAAEKTKNKPKEATPKAKDKEEDPFLDVLKSLEDIKTPGEKNVSSKEFSPPTPPQLEDILSMSELDLVRQQLNECWSLPLGAMDAKNLVVKLEVTIGPDAIVQSVKVLNEAQGRKKPYFKIAVESAKRALYHSYCTPLKLPKDRYNEWKTIIFTFDPKDMFP